jgi:hypothetical protein
MGTGHVRRAHFRVFRGFVMDGEPVVDSRCV